MSIQKERSEILVLGGGPGGYVAALSAAQRGARVILVEKARVGGTCLNIGCIPTKALTTSVDLLLHSRRGKEFGLSIPSVDVDLPALMTYKQNTVEQLVSGVESLLKARRVKVIRGEARLIKTDTLFIDDGQGGQQEVSADRIILAPGSVAADLPIEGCHLSGVLTSTQALDIDAVPARLVIVGGGVIGLEFACIYEALGSKVTILEMTPSLLSGATDEVLAKRLQILLGRRGMEIRTGVTVRKIERDGETLRVFAEAAGLEAMIECDRVLVATGRRPNTQNMGFAEVGLNMNGHAIAVNESLATSIPNVWAAGDVTGGWLLAHKAMVDGRVAAENATGGRRQIDYRAVPSVIFTRPEIASVGLTELQARATGAAVKVSQFLFSANPRARILGDSDGMVRLVCDADNGRILGVHMLGPHVTDLIAEGALAVQTGRTADDLAWTMHAHPTLPEAMLEAALGFRNAAIHAISR
ncbi:MAG: dihydrolipoyl dehydrogenase [Kiritimatiellae bacterium]|nr:dihydrolipoyl dehydrogenase [Kiritimatiellia bacterium]MDD5519538.1 dihydrolipoyl dehydrogenase [Kiritimatiellia bacterium]